jgi:hypothetical protein
MNNDIRELNIIDLDTVTGGDDCVHGSGKCPNNGQGDGLGQLRQIESGLIEVGKTLVAGIGSML